MYDFFYQNYKNGTKKLPIKITRRGLVSRLTYIFSINSIG